MNPLPFPPSLSMVAHRNSFHPNELSVTQNALGSPVRVTSISESLIQNPTINDFSSAAALSDNIVTHGPAVSSSLPHVDLRESSHDSEHENDNDNATELTIGSLERSTSDSSFAGIHSSQFSSSSGKSYHPFDALQEEEDKAESEERHREWIARSEANSASPTIEDEENLEHESDEPEDEDDDDEAEDDEENDLAELPSSPSPSSSPAADSSIVHSSTASSSSAASRASNPEFSRKRLRSILLSNFHRFLSVSELASLASNSDPWALSQLRAQRPNVSDKQIQELWQKRISRPLSATELKRWNRNLLKTEGIFIEKTAGPPVAFRMTNQELARKEMDDKKDRKKKLIKEKTDNEKQAKEINESVGKRKRKFSHAKANDDKKTRDEGRKVRKKNAKTGPRMQPASLQRINLTADRNREEITSGTHSVPSTTSSHATLSSTSTAATLPATSPHMPRALSSPSSSSSLSLHPSGPPMSSLISFNSTAVSSMQKAIQQTVQAELSTLLAQYSQQMEKVVKDIQNRYEAEVLALKDEIRQLKSAKQPDSHSA